MANANVYDGALKAREHLKWIAKQSSDPEAAKSAKRALQDMDTQIKDMQNTLEQSARQEGVSMDEFAKSHPNLKDTIQYVQACITM